MLVRHDAVLLRIVVGQYDHHDKRPLSECLLLKARELNLQSGTVVQSRAGFKSPVASKAQKTHYGAWDNSVVIEFVGSLDQINLFIEISEALLLDARMTTQKVTSLNKE
jgi:PII-like signaling protein